MSDKKNSFRGITIDGGKLKSVAGGPGDGCGVSEEQFPSEGKCYNKNITKGGIVYKEKCPYCRIMVSMPEAVTLRVNHIFDCTQYFYGKRINKP